METKDAEMDQNVQRAINSGLFIVERNLRNLIKQLEESHGADWILRKSVNDIREEETRQLIEKSGILLNEICELGKAYNLEQNVESTRWRSLNDLSEIWTVLNELTPKQLGGYGTMTQVDNDMLTDRINKMLTICNEMRTILSGQV
ncbi:MAG TPA: hypothetical protein VJZ32_12715 [Candidatus Bathyarchaeia archaeon]|nr:hypothetical protein [Candidatus Bathyarchaeia archaeon]